MTSQYIGLTFGQTCHDAGIAQSMGAVGSRFDNAVAETFFATLTKELLLHDTPKGGWTTRAGLRSAVFEFIEGLQPDPAALDAGDALPGRVRGRPRCRRPLRPRAHVRVKSRDVV